jgi:hypothetical protein
MKGRAFWIGLFAACSIGVGNAAAAAQPASPPPGYDIDAEYTQKSPDGSTTIEQYQNKGDWTWQFWVRRQETYTQLDPGPEPAGYSADFNFTKDLNWIVREQKIGSGTSTLYLYRLTPEGYVLASEKPLGEFAWDYMKTRPDWRKIMKAPEYHNSAFLLDGFAENYRKLGVDWAANRYVLIALSGDADVKGRKPMQTGVVNGWTCRYDLQTGKFDVPSRFSRDNAKALKPE